ncbi:hypothetical protein L0U85_00625 [Glycomyces sp. L485]|uniref:hypothetical protein n=1 Tax=Glycomyces sp. L485 TaxID=2909235 RepID=UPI001F4BCC18|nr:hypothetical protein [Glycomyces sp. L485]MCH7229373.1 hypothetical protein [Glycomyces sp. L485]
MDPASERTLTDIDEYVTVRTAQDGSIAVEPSAAGFRRPPSELARVIVETASRLPEPASESRKTIESGADAVADMHRALATGGFEAVSEMMRRRLGIEAPANALPRNPDLDATLAAALGSTLDTMRQSVAGADTVAPAEILEATATTEEGDVGVTTSSARLIAAVWIGPAARRRGVEGLGETLTSLLAKARAALEEKSRERLGPELPEEVVETMDTAPEEGEKAGQTTARMMDEAVRRTESLRRKAGK